MEGDELDGNCVTGLWAEIVEEFCNSLFSVCVGSERIDDPNLTEMDCCGESSGLWVPGDKFHILNSASLFNLLVCHVKSLEIARENLLHLGW